MDDSLVFNLPESTLSLCTQTLGSCSLSSLGRQMLSLCHCFYDYIGDFDIEACFVLSESEKACSLLVNISQLSFFLIEASVVCLLKPPKGQQSWASPPGGLSYFM